jgi:hypothetical protein
VTRVFVARAPELVAAVVGAVIAVARSSFGAGFVAFVIVSLGLELVLELRERILSRSPDRLAKVARGHLRAVGIEPQSDDGDLWSASVLVFRTTAARSQVFGLDGRVLATGESVGGWVVGESFSPVMVYSMPEGGSQLEVMADRTLNPRSYTVAYAVAVLESQRCCCSYLGG